MIKKVLLLCLFSMILTLPLVAFAMPPMSGGEVTSPYGPRDAGGRASSFHKGVDVYVPSGTAIVAPVNGTVGHGAGGGYIYWCDIEGDDGNYYLFGDCGGDTLICSTGYVNAGTVIGYTGGDSYDGPLGYSSGEHVHIEVHPGGEGCDAVDPVPYLEALGMDLSGNTMPSGGGSLGGSDNINLPWGIESMYQLGDSVNQFMKTIVDATGKGYILLQASAMALLTTLCIIDVTLPLLISQTISLSFIITKVMKYGFLFFVLTNWSKIINDFFLSMVTSVSGTFIGDSSIIANNVSQPQLLMQKCVFMVSPALNKIASYGSIDFLQNFGTIIPIYFMTFLTLGVFFYLVCYIMLVYVEFYVSAALCVCTFPFSALGFTKFIGEGSIGQVVTCTLKLMILSIMVALCVFCIKDASPKDIFKVTTPATTVTGSGSVSGPTDLVAIATEKANKYGIPVTLFLAQIQSESSWNPNAISSGGAEGLGQLMPDTAAGLGCADPFNPEQNLDASAQYMQYLHDKFGDWNYALAAYNGGPNSISKGEPLPGWAQDYVNQVNGNLSGSYIANNGISAEAMSKYIFMCLSLIGLAFLTMRIPKSLTQSLGGRFELS